jgi:hypothetical protein
MNTGAEAVETALKICRKWGYEVKVFLKIKLKLLFVKIIFMEEQRLFHFQMMKMHVRILDPLQKALSKLLMMMDPRSSFEIKCEYSWFLSGTDSRWRAFMYLLKAIWLKRFVQLIMCYLLLTKCRQGLHVLEDC